MDASALVNLPHPSAQLSQSSAGRSLRRASILLVDDYEPNLAALEATLAPIDASFVKAASGEEALERVSGQEFALVLLDIRMRGIDGIETAARLNAGHRGHEIPIILLTAYELSDQDLRRAYARGVVDVLRKPLLPEIVHAKTRVFVELFLQRDEIQ